MSSGCAEWHYVLYGEDDQEKGSDFDFPNTLEALEFGEWPVGFVAPVPTCTEDDSPDVFDMDPPDVYAPTVPSAHDPMSEVEVTTEYAGNYEYTIHGRAPAMDLGYAKLGHLASGSLQDIPGGVGAPRLDSAEIATPPCLLDDPCSTVRLRFSGQGSNVVQYRFWPYDGGVPSHLDVPYTTHWSGLVFGPSPTLWA